MWRRLLLPVVLVGLFFSSFAGASAHAQTLRPLLDCSLTCVSDVQYGPVSWYAYGGSIIVTVSNPNVPSYDSWYRSVTECNTSNHECAEVIILKNGSGYQGFGCPPGGPYYLMIAGTLQSPCIQAPAGDINWPAFIKIGDYVSNGGGNLLQINGSSGQPNNLFVPYSNGASKNWNQKSYHEEIYDANITTHIVWGSDWSYSSWYDGNGTQHYDGAYPSATHHPYGPPPAMYWNDQNNHGGDLYSCIYPTFSNDPPCVQNQ